MNELEKLRTLIPHWVDHNNEHAQTYKEWAEKAEALNRKDISALLHKISTETERLNGLFEEIRNIL